MNAKSLADEIATRLEDLMLHQTQFMIIEPAGSPYYVQFLGTVRGELYCEAVGNEFLAPGDQLDGEAELRLIGLGWASAEPNFKQLWDEPIPFAEIGDRMARTLREVYGVTGLENLAFRYGPRTTPNATVVSARHKTPSGESSQGCRPGWVHAAPCAPTAEPGFCACGCRVDHHWCREDVECPEPGCRHRMYFHLDTSCWHDDNCTCRRRGRVGDSPDGYLANIDANALMATW